MSVLGVTGTSTGVGKTIVTAAVAALCPDVVKVDPAHFAGGKIALEPENAAATLARGAWRGGVVLVVTAAVAALCPDVVTVLKPAQTGLPLNAPGDVDEVKRLVPHVETMELARYPEPLAPAAAARRSGIPTVSPAEVVEGIEEADADLVLMEGAGGLLVRFSDVRRPPAGSTGAGHRRDGCGAGHAEPHRADSGSHGTARHRVRGPGDRGLAGEPRPGQSDEPARSATARRSAVGRCPARWDVLPGAQAVRERRARRAVPALRGRVRCG